MVCGGTGCHSSSSHILIQNLKDELKAHTIWTKKGSDSNRLLWTMSKGPIVIIYPEGTFYSHVQPADLKKCRKHIIGKEIVDRLVLDEIKADPNDGLEQT